MNPPPLDEDPRDAHLLAALRHAPDRGLGPPAHVTAAILGQARQAVRPPHGGRRSWQQGLRAALARLWQPAPMAAFSTLAMATLIGVMWGGREPPDATPGLRPASVAALPAASSAASDVVAPSLRPTVADALPSVVPQPRTASLPKPDGPPVAKSTLVLPPPATPAAPGTTPEPAATEVRQDGAAQRRLAKEAVAEATAPVAAAAAPRDVMSRGFADAAPTPARVRSEAGALGAAAAAAPAAALPVSSLAPLSDARAAEPLAAIDAALAGGARWQASGVAGDRSHGDTQRAFWASVRTATQGRWQSVPPIAPFVPWLLVGRGSSDAVIWVVDGALHVTMEGRTWRAPVEPAQVREWQEGIARW